MKNIRNFCIIAHIDHGKSTLADRLLELTGTVSRDKMRPQYLDMMDLEREKGITIKMQPVRMLWHLIEPEGSQEFILNLIDTPGHVDFGYEVSRAMNCVEGAVLLVDATQGIQAQTIANLEQAQKQNLVVIPAINKIDSPQAKIEETAEELSNLLKIDRSEILGISAKTGANIEELLSKVIERVPPPKTPEAANPPLRALVFDSRYDSYKGVIAFVRIVDGTISANEKIYLMQNKAEGVAKEVGFFKPDLVPSNDIKAGEIGYIATGIKEPEKVRVGDTITKLEIRNTKYETLALPGYQVPRPMVFASVYPENPDDFENLKNALGKLRLNDPAVFFEPESKEALGRGYRCGFLGTLHAEIVSERLRREFGLELIISRPQVFYKIIGQKGGEIPVFSPSDWPDPGVIKEILEPWVQLEVISPFGYMGQLLGLLNGLEGKQIKIDYIGKERVVILYEAPLRKIISGFYDNLKSASQGYGSMNYKVLGERAGDLSKIDILIAGRKEDFLSKIVGRGEAFEEGKKMVSKLKNILPPQLFSVPLQAAISGKIIARETLGAKRRDVIAPLYGGDYTRKRKLLERQKEGKKELKEKGQMAIPPKVFLEMFKI